MKIDQIFLTAASIKGDVLSVYKKNFRLNDDLTIDDRRNFLLCAIEDARSKIDSIHNSLSEIYGFHQGSLTDTNPSGSIAILNAFMEMAELNGEMQPNEKSVCLLVHVTAEREVLLDLLKEYMLTFGDPN